MSPQARADGRIFVQIAAYRDPELVPTLRDCVAKAVRPDLLTFGLAWQHDETESLAEFADDPRVRLFECHWRESRGVCWARHALQGFYGGEEFTLALDSHHRFERGWDRDLKRQLAAAPSRMPVLTAYLPAYEPDKPLPRQRDPIILAADDFAPDGVLPFLPRRVKAGPWARRPIPARFLSAHFTFARGEFLETCRHDPKLYFLGEEITLAVRAFTHGFDLFHPRAPVIYHFYKRDGRPKHWDDHSPRSGLAFGASVYDHISKARVRQVLGMAPGDADLGPYGLGAVRSLADYERYAGVDFARRTVSQAARDGATPAPLHRKRARG